MFTGFFNEYKDMVFKRDFDYNEYGYTNTEFLECEICGSYFAEYVFGHCMCEDCFECLLEAC